MNEWFNEIGAGRELPASAARDLLDSGFIVIPEVVATERMGQFCDAYDLAMASAAAPDLSIGSSTTRVHDFVSRGAEFDPLYVYRPILEACHRTIRQPFKLGSMLGRTVRPHSQAQPLHVDFRPDTDGWPMVGFIVMVDDFRTDNGATRFVPGSHKSEAIPGDFMTDLTSDHACQVLACGSAGSVIVYNGSVWHGHTANRSREPRRSVQGSYIRRNARAWIDWAARVRPETVSRIGGLAGYLLDLESSDRPHA